jgi:hypothetical protein
MNIGIEINQNLVGKDWLEKRGHPMNPALSKKCLTPDISTSDVEGFLICLR